MNNFELLVRAVIIKDRKILVCQTEGREYCFLPGGHIEFKESMQIALKRELDEELGVRVVQSKFIGGVENIFTQNEVPTHEVSFLFHVEVEGDTFESKEDHIRFYWLTYEEFVEKKIMPPAMKDAVLQWIVEKKPFFIEEGMKQ